jgi:hypothetical protein
VPAIVFLAFMLLWPRPGAAQTPPRDTAAAAAGTSAVRGRVLDDKGAPIRKAIVSVTSPTLRVTRAVLTGADGRYEVKNLPAGRYAAAVTKTTYLRVIFGQQRPLGLGTPFDLAESQTLGGVDFTMRHDGVVAGRIVDEFNDPVADIRVSVMRYQTVPGTRRLMEVRGASTNDAGDYRIYGLAPGDYYVLVQPANYPFFDDTTDRSALAPVYYPGTGNVGDAQKLTIAVGQTLSGINLTLQPVRAARVSGTLVDSQGRPVTTSRVILSQQSASQRFMSAPVRADGFWTIGGVTPGEYTVRASAAGPDAEVAVQTITIAGDDVAGIALMTMPLSVVRGRVILDSTPGVPPLRPASVRVSATVVTGGAGGANAPVKDDSSFEMKMPPGRVILRAIISAPDWRVRSIRLDGVDVTDRGMDVPAAGVVANVTVELTTTRTELSGTIRTAAGTQTRDATVVLFAQDSELWGTASRYLALGSPDLDGVYKVRLTPGAYYAIALTEIDRSEWNSPETLGPLRDRAVPFTIAEGESKVLDLTVSAPQL